MASWITERPTSLILDRSSPTAWWREEPLSSLVRPIHLRRVEDVGPHLAGEPPPCGLVLETAHRGEVPEVVEAAHRHRPDLPVLVVARNATLQDSAEVFRMGASFLPRPDSPGLLARDVALFLSRRMLPEERRRVALPSFCEEHGISQRRAEMVALMAVGYGRKELPAELGLSDNSVKSHVRQTIRRVGCMNLECLIARLDDYAVEHLRRLVGRSRDATGRQRLQSELRSRGQDGDPARDSSEWKV